MEQSRETTVLFAQILNAQALYDKAGDKLAHEAIERCHLRLARAVEAGGGRMLQAVENRVMVLAASPDQAADTGSAMHLAMEKLPKTADVKLAAGIAFHHGPIIQKGDEIFGDTVNLAAQLTVLAGAGQLLTDEWTGKLLSPLYRAWMRTLDKAKVKGRSEEIGLCELVWRADENATAFMKQRPEDKPPAPAAGLILKYREKRLTRRREKELITMGRGEDCGLQVASEQASRHHCTIERRKDKWVVIDNSTNGTYVSIDGSAEVALNREELMLTKHGFISFGEPRVHATEVVEFTIE